LDILNMGCNLIGIELNKGNFWWNYVVTL
jgi:hypothetical protein